MRGSLGRGGAAVMKGILKTSTTHSQPPIVPGTELEPHLAPGAPRERIVHSSMRLYVDNCSGNGGPGIRDPIYAPDFLHQRMEGLQTCRQGVPNRRLVEDGTLASAISLRVDDGTPICYS